MDLVQVPPEDEEGGDLRQYGAGLGNNNNNNNKKQEAKKL
jgi:hypothetical protein